MKPAYGVRSPLVGGLLSLLVAASAAAQPAVPGPWPKRVLIVNSFGREFEPFISVTSAFRAELARLLGGRVEFVETPMQAIGSAGPGDSETLVRYLRTLFTDRHPDLLVPVALPAASFALANRAALFPETPLLAIGYDAERLPAGRLGPGDTGVPIRVDPQALVEEILRLLPETRAVTIVLGASTFERTWGPEFRRRLEPLSDRVALHFVDSLSLDGMRQRLATLPPHSAVIYVGLLMDAAGVPWEQDRALAVLHQAANAPIFGLFGHHVRQGILGGALIEQADVGKRAAEVAARLLAGETAGTIREAPLSSAPVFDGRELRRWHIPEDRLPPGSLIVNRPRGFWAEYGRVGLVVLVIVGLQSALIAGLTVQRARRRRAEISARELAHRLLTAQEDERRRLARELHDDLTQRLACVAIDAAHLEKADSSGSLDGKPRSIREALVRLSDDVHALSYRLHPSLLDDLGLAEALKAECNQIARQESLTAALDRCELPRPLPDDIALGLFRVAQEALRNAVRHGKASRIDVSLLGTEYEVDMVVRDNGAGFNPSRRERHSLGLMGMRERMHLLGGTLVIASAPGAGTTITARIPMIRRVG